MGDVDGPAGPRGLAGVVGRSLHTGARPVGHRHSKGVGGAIGQAGHDRAGCAAGRGQAAW